MIIFMLSYMKSLSAFLLLAAFSHPGVCSAQQAAMMLHSMNVVYCNQDNQLIYASTGGDQRNLVFVSDNGSFDTMYQRLDELYGGINWRPTNTGKTRVTVYTRDKGKLKQIDSFQFRVKRSFPLIAKVGNVSRGQIDASKLRAEYMPAAILQESFEARGLPLSGYEILFIRDSEVVAERFHRGEDHSRFKDDSVTFSMLQQVRPGDVVWLRNIVHVWGNQTYRLNEIILHVK